MCGIVGIVTPVGCSVDVGALQRATTAIRHRGPDDEGYLLIGPDRTRVVSAGGADSDPSLSLPPIASFAHEQWSVALGHRRLSILDLSPAGHQPMSSPDARCWITYNGEIYNFVELRRELVALGVRFRTECDTEVLLAAYRAWGEDMLPHLVGMFAFVIVDLDRGRVLLARDPFGIKPLYYVRTSLGLAFASELKALLEFPGISREVNASELFRYLRFGWTDGTDATFFKHIEQLPAASVLSLSLDRPTEGTPAPYWSLGTVPVRQLSFQEATDEVRHTLSESVRLHMRSDVPVGACLSGGLDSSILVRMMRDQLGPAGDLHTFSFITADPRLNEGPYVDIMAALVGSRSHLVSPSAEDLAADFDDLIRTQDQPFGGTSIYAQYCVFRLAQQAGMKVMLDGQGSDELFGGYLTAISAQVAALLSARRVLDAVALWKAGDFTSAGARNRMLLSALGRMLPPRLAGMLMPLAGESLMPEWMVPEYFRDRGVVVEPRPQGRGRDALRQELLLFTQSMSLPLLLRYEDRNSMRFSIESRVPFCNTAVAELAMSLPQDYLVTRSGSTKAVLRHAAEGMVPSAILQRPKVGFSTPESEWFSHLGPWSLRQLDGETARSAPFLKHAALGDLVGAQAKGRAVFRPSLWRVLNVLRWAELFNVTFA